MAYGVRGTANHLLEFYLCSFTQDVEIDNNMKSKSVMITQLRGLPTRFNTLLLFRTICTLMVRLLELRHSRRNSKKLGSYVQSKVRIPLNFLIAKGITYRNYYSKNPENVFPKRPNYLKYFPQKIIKSPKSAPKADENRTLTMNDFESVSSFSSDTIINFKVHSDMEVEFKKDIRYRMFYKGLAEDEQVCFGSPYDHSSTRSEETDSSFFSTHISSLSSSFPVEKESASLPHRPGSPGTTTSLISEENIGYDSSDSEEEDLDISESQITSSCVSSVSRISLTHPLDVYSREKEPEFMDILATSLKRSRTDLHHLFPEFSDLVNKSIDDLDNIDKKINALSCEDILPGEDVSDFSSVKWLPFTRAQERYGKQVLREGGELFSSISSDTVIGRKINKKWRPLDSDSAVIVKHSESGLSLDALDDYRQRPVVRYDFTLDRIISEEETLKAGCKIPGRSSEVSLNTFLGIH